MLVQTQLEEAKRARDATDNSDTKSELDARIDQLSRMNTLLMLNTGVQYAITENEIKMGTSDQFGSQKAKYEQLAKETAFSSLSLDEALMKIHDESVNYQDPEVRAIHTPESIQAWLDATRATETLLMKLRQEQIRVK